MTAEQLITRNLHVAKTEDRKVKLYSMVFHPDGDITVGGDKVNEEEALAILKEDRNAKTVREAAAPAAKVKKVNTATKLLLLAIHEQLKESGKPFLVLGSDIKILPHDQPRLTNLKKMGWVQTITDGTSKKRLLLITPEGKEAIKS